MCHIFFSTTESERKDNFNEQSNIRRMPIIKCHHKNNKEYLNISKVKLTTRIA